MLEPRISDGVRTEGTRKRVDGGSEEHKAARAFATEGQVLVGGLCAEGNRVQHAEPAWMVL